MIIGTSLEALTPRFIANGDLSAVQQSLLSEIVSCLKDLKIEALEIPLDAMIIYPSLFTEQAIAQMGEVFQQQGIAISVHLPYMWCDPASLDEAIRSASVKTIIASHKAVQVLNPRTCVLHLTGERGEAIASSHADAKEKAFYFARMAAQARKSVGEICQELDPHTVCVENLPGFPFELLSEEVLTQKARFCFDVGHCVIRGGDPHLYLEEDLQQIGVIHLHDVAPIHHDGATRLTDHQPLGSGIVNGRRIMAALKRKHYAGIVILEVPTKDALMRSLVNLAADGD